MTTTPFVHWPEGLVLLLASLSPRRAELLRTAGIPFEAQAAAGVESAQAAVAASLRQRPDRYALHLAAAKAEAVACEAPRRLILGADTVVVLDGRILEKPADRQDAVRILNLLSGRRHRVITALALLGGPARSRWTGWEETEVEFLPLTDEVIERYIETGEPFDKAGAYGIQGYGALMVRRIEGCYFNVMGLPLALLGQALRRVLKNSAAIDSEERR